MENLFAEYAIGGIQNRNKIYKQNEFKLNGIRTDCFRSLFLFDENFKYYVDKTGSVKGYSGKHITDGLVFDFDGENLNEVKKEVYNFIQYLYYTFEVAPEYLHISFSGNKGFHIVIPFELIEPNPQPREDFYLVIKNFAKELAEGFKFVDTSIYESKRLFRMLNTKNSKSGLYKIPLSFDELDKFSIEEIKQIASQPRNIEHISPGELEINKSLNELFHKWNEVNFNEQSNNSQIKNSAKRNELLDIIDNGVSEGNRHSALIRLTAMFEKQNFDYDFILAFLKIWNEKNKPSMPIERLESESKQAFESLRKNKQDISEFKIYNLEQAEGEYRNYIQRMGSFKVKTGYETIDKKIRGIMPGETMCILGKTSVGKSALLQNIGINFVKETKQPCLFFSLEMPITSVYERALQVEMNITGYEVENFYLTDSSDFKLKAKLVFNSLKDFYTITKSGLTLEEIKNLIQFAEDNIYHKKTGLVLVDYLGLIQSKGKDIYEQVSRVARGMKDLAKELNIPIIFLSQVNRNYKDYDELDLSSARDSGVIDEASDFILGIWKEKNQEDNQPEIKLKLGLLKNRKGGLGRTSIDMNKRSLRILENEEGTLI